VIYARHAPRAPAVVGVFIFSIDHQEPSFSLQCLAPSPSTLPNYSPIKTLSAKPKNPGHTKTILNTFPPTSTLIPSTHSPTTSLPIAITDAVRTAKLHRNLVPLVRDLIETTIKCKRQLLLPWRDTPSLASMSTSCLHQSLEHP